VFRIKIVSLDSYSVEYDKNPKGLYNRKEKVIFLRRNKYNLITYYHEVVHCLIDLFLLFNIIVNRPLYTKYPNLLKTNKHELFIYSIHLFFDKIYNFTVLRKELMATSERNIDLWRSHRIKWR